MRILLSAYACQPGFGSEPGVGWGWATALAAAGHDVTVLTRANNRPAIDTAGPVERVRFVYLDLPDWILRLKRGGFGIRAYYAVWQLAAFRVARHECRSRNYDLVQHVTFAKYATPCYLAWLPLPFVWGPVGGGEHAPVAFWPALGLRGALFEAARVLGRWAAHANPLVRGTARRSRLALASTPETAQRLEALGCRRVIVLSQAALPIATAAQLAMLRQPLAPAPLRLACCGELVPLKGWHLAIRALARAGDGCRLEVLGRGRWRGHLERLARRCGVADRIVFHGRLPQQAAWRQLAGCHALLHPTLHDSAGLAAVEAMAIGLPVIALRLGGSAELVAPDAGILVDAVRPDAAVAGLAAAIVRLRDEPGLREALSAGARAHVWRHLLWPQRIAALRTALETEPVA